MNEVESAAEIALRTNLALGARILSSAGHDDFNQGQISGRIPGSKELYIKTALTGFDEATPTDYVREPINSAQPLHRMSPPELPLHTAIYAARPDVNAIVHSHAPAGLVFGALEDLDLLPLSHEGAILADAAHRFALTSNTVLEREIGDAIAASLGAGIAVFLVNHGTVVVGKSFRHATVFALMLERACDLQLRAVNTQHKYSISSQEDVAAKQQFIFADVSVRSYWDHAVRGVRRRGANW